MSEIIKPEDVPDVLVEHYLSTKLGVSWKHLIASDMNAAIEAGIVSPPCYCLRLNGELQMVHFTDNPKVFAGKPWSQDAEHYKGQTE